MKLLTSYPRSLSPLILMAVFFLCIQDVASSQPVDEEDYRLELSPDIRYPAAYVPQPSPRSLFNNGIEEASGTDMATRDSSRLTVTIRDFETGKRTPVRITLTDRQGRHTRLPGEAIKVMYGRNDTAERYGFQPDSAFYIDGQFSLGLTPGVYKLNITKGNEYLAQKHSLDLRSGNMDTTVVMKRWINMPERGWYSSDLLRKQMNDCFSKRPYKPIMLC